MPKKGTIYVNITTEDGELLDRFRVEAIDLEKGRPTYHLAFFDNDGEETDHSEVESTIRIRARQQLSKKEDKS